MLTIDHTFNDYESDSYIVVGSLNNNISREKFWPCIQNYKSVAILSSRHVEPFSSEVYLNLSFLGQLHFPKCINLQGKKEE